MIKSKILKVNLFLTKTGEKTYTHAYKMFDSNQHINFGFSDVIDNFKLRLNESLECNKYTYTFHPNEEFHHSRIFLINLAEIYQK